MPDVNSSHGDPPKELSSSEPVAAQRSWEAVVLRTIGLGAAALRLNGPLLPDAVLPCFGHQKEGEQEGHGGERDRIGKSPAETPGGEIGGGRDDRHETASPAIANVIRHGHGRVPNAAREKLSQEGADGAVGHPNVVDENHHDEHRHGMVDGARLRVPAERLVERVVRQSCEEHPPKDDRLPPNLVRKPAPEDQGWRGNQQPDAHDVARGQDVELLDGLQEVEGPELPAIPDASLPQHDNARDYHVADVPTKESLSPGIEGGLPLGFNLLEDRSLSQRKPDVDRNSHKQQRKDEWDPPPPLVERVHAQVGPGANDHGQGDHDAEGGRRL